MVVYKKKGRSSKNSSRDGSKKISKRKISLSSTRKAKARKSTKSFKIRSLELRTDIDLLYELIQKKGTLSLKAAVSELGLSLDQAELFAQILSKHNLIKLDYPYFGFPRLQKILPEDFISSKSISLKSKSGLETAYLLIPLLILLAIISLMIKKGWLGL